MWPLGLSRRQQSLCFKFLYTIRFENTAVNKQERRKENAAKKTIEDVESFESAAHGIRMENEEIRTESIVSD